ncbi:putative phage abortive infection protein [Sphingobacterium sp. UBA5670]|uniref:putative phage abortive infection protein n=1 Tax=Sphingobacterium sp. UBA5670 TaxID=1947502 RepID=UPI0025EA9DCC|nr:putative phage abortive infection protein [Sphingobacterium sp. UBA5670]
MNNDNYFSLWFLGTLIPVLGFFVLIVGTYILTKRHYKIQRNKNEASFWIVFLLIISAALIIFAFLAPLVYTGSNSYSSIVYQNTGVIGDTIGGVMNPFIGIAAVIVTGLAFYAQYQANEEVRKQFLKQEQKYLYDKFENRLFKLIENYNQTVNQFKCNSRDSNEIFTGKDIFFAIHQEFKATLKEVQRFNKLNQLKCHDICEKDFEKSELFFLELKITYVIVFYGVSEHGQKTVVKKLKRLYREEYLNKLTNYLSYKPEGFNKETEIINDWKNICITTVQNRCIKQFIRYNNGHQSRLGHYYRQLYMIVKFIDDENGLKYLEKWDHSKYLRSLFSNHEQIIFYLNSISILGHDWEINKKDQNEMFVTKYDLIKNIPDSYRDKYCVNTIYPDIEYEGQLETSARNQLNSNYC